MIEKELVPLVRVDQPKIGQLFVDYLKSQNISAALQQDNASFVIVCEQEYHQQAAAMFNEFAQSPYHPKYQQAAWQNGDADSPAYTMPTGNNHLISRFLQYAGPVTLVIFALCWLVFVLSVLGWQSPLFGWLKFYSGLSITELISAPQRIIGPAFFHFSLLHIAFNTMWWWQLGGNIENVAGKGTLLQLFLVSAIASNLAQFLMSGNNFGGLSGVVYATLGFVWIGSHLKPNSGLVISRSIVGFMLVWLALGYVDILPINMANTAHLIGLISGCLLALLWSKSKMA